MSNLSSSCYIIKFPKLRFKGFTEPWKSILFKDLFDYIPNNTFSRAELNYTNGTVKNIHYGDILVKFNSILDISHEELPYITNAMIIDYSTKRLKNGDIIIADTAEDETVGKAIEIFGIGNQCVVSGLHTIVCRPKFSMYPMYLGQYMNSLSYHKQLIPLMQGVKVLSISKSNIELTNIHYPSIKEQNKISTLLSLLDRKIKKHQQLIEVLKKYKRGLLSTVFQQITDYVSLSEISKYTSSGKSLEQINCMDLGEYPVYDASGIATYIKQYDMDNDYIAIIKDGSGVGRIQYCKKKSSFIGTLGAITAVNCSTYYLFTVLQSVNFKNYVTGATIPHIYYKDYKKIQIPFPSKKKQKQIEYLFREMDLVCASNEELLSKLLLIKKSLLHQLFI